MPVDHPLQGHTRGTAHHGVEEIGLKRLSTAAQDLGADALIKLLGIEHQAVEIEHHGARRDVIRSHSHSSSTGNSRSAAANSANTKQVAPQIHCESKQKHGA